MRGHNAGTGSSDGGHLRHGADPTGGGVAGAMVTVKSLETGASRVTTTDSAGHYTVLSLPLGPQEVKAEKAGFKAAVRTGIDLVVGQEAVVNLQLGSGRTGPASDRRG